METADPRTDSDERLSDESEIDESEHKPYSPSVILSAGRLIGSTISNLDHGTDNPVGVAVNVLAAWEIWHMAHCGIDATERQVLLPIVLFSLGLGAVFPTITALGLGQIRRERMGYATTLFGMIINGAATGIAIVSNALASRHSFHQTQLAT